MILSATTSERRYSFVHPHVPCSTTTDGALLAEWPEACLWKFPKTLSMHWQDTLLSQRLSSSSCQTLVPLGT